MQACQHSNKLSWKTVASDIVALLGVGDLKFTLEIGDKALKAAWMVSLRALACVQRGDGQSADHDASSKG
ncbi:hypothetical protein GCM10023067_54040 [Aminobacter aganoensis]